MESIGPYRLDSELGRGAMGVVFRGFDPAIGRAVAIKIIRLDEFAAANEKAEIRFRFAREATAAGKLSHPNIVTVYHLGEQGDLQYLVLELVDGWPLAKSLSDGIPRDRGASITILSQVAGALDYAHREGIVHRDVKPANILVSPDGRVKITDFGIARISSQTVTRTGAIFGTPAYMAPEQILSARVNGQADQFSLAVIAYQMLSGRRPFIADTDAGLIFKITSEEPQPLHELDNSFPRRSSDVLRRGMAKDPDQRYSTCVEFIKDLSESLEEQTLGMPVAAFSPFPAAVTSAEADDVRARKRVPGRAIAFGAGLLVMVILLGALVAFERRAQRPVAYSPAAAPPPPRPVEVAALPAVALPPPNPAKVALPAAALPTRVNHGPHVGDSKVNSRDGLNYVWIPPGTFMMGCSPGDTECNDREKPAHQVTISSGFWMGQTEVTQEAYARVVGINPSYFKGAKRPVERVSWHEAQSYCEAAGMRLPTEAEWEYAARAGSSAKRYGDLDAIAWYGDDSGRKSHEVGQKQANAWGLFDTLGNVGEWVADLYQGYVGGSTTDPRGPATGTHRVVRGESAFAPAFFSRVSERGLYDKSVRGGNIGIRCAGSDLPALKAKGGAASASEYGGFLPDATPPEGKGGLPLTAAPPIPRVGDSKVNSRDGLKYTWIPPGTFMMGCSRGDTECKSNETPAREVAIKTGFWMGQTNVTQAAYQRVMLSNPSDFRGDNLPVDSLLWGVARSYCESIGGRLPTEAEWEYAARAGSTAARYGNLGDIAWYSSNSGGKTHEVGQKQPNAFGLYDMLGNVQQWTADSYGEDGGMRVIRGGAWDFAPRYVRVSARFGWSAIGFPGIRGVGVRCVVE